MCTSLVCGIGTSCALVVGCFCFSKAVLCTFRCGAWHTLLDLCHRWMVTVVQHWQLQLARCVTQSLGPDPFADLSTNVVANLKPCVWFKVCTNCVACQMRAQHLKSAVMYGPVGPAGALCMSCACGLHPCAHTACMGVGPVVSCHAVCCNAFSAPCWLSCRAVPRCVRCPTPLEAWGMRCSPS